MDGVLETLPTVSKVHYGETLDIPWQMWSHLFSALMYFTNNIKCSTFNEDCLFSQNILTLTLLLRLNYLKLHWTLIKLNLATELYFRVKWTIVFVKNRPFHPGFHPYVNFLFSNHMFSWTMLCFKTMICNQN
jgi:hypothetical protein